MNMEEDEMEEWVKSRYWMDRKDWHGVIFKGNCTVKANYASQCEGLAVLRALKEALLVDRREISVRIFTDSEVLVQPLI